MIRRGFTLVELLIVIVVIGILSAAMVMASSEAVTTAKATAIINDLRILQTAGQHWYFDNEANLVHTTNGYKFKLNGKNEQLHDILQSDTLGVKKYISNQNFALNTGESGDYQNMYASVGGYSVYLGFNNTVCYSVFRISDNAKMTDQSRLREKLKSRAKSSRLVYYNYNGGANKQKETPYNGENFVCMKIFSLE